MAYTGQEGVPVKGLKTSIAALQAMIEETGAEPNVIETVKVNGAALTPDASKAVDITVPTTAGDLDAYTKDEVDDKMASMYSYKGSYDTFAELLADVTAGTITPQVGDGYNIMTAGGTDEHGHSINAGDNVVWSGMGWDVHGGDVDLSAYSTTTQMNTAISTATTPLSTKLATIAEGATKVEASTTNGNIKVNGTETNVYTLPSDVMHGVMATDEQIDEMLTDLGLL